MGVLQYAGLLVRPDTCQQALFVSALLFWEQQEEVAKAMLHQPLVVFSRSLLFVTVTLVFLFKKEQKKQPFGFEYMLHTTAFFFFFYV